MGIAFLVHMVGWRYKGELLLSVAKEPIPSEQEELGKAFSHKGQLIGWDQRRGRQRGAADLISAEWYSS